MMLAPTVFSHTLILYYLGYLVKPGILTSEGTFFILFASSN